MKNNQKYILLFLVLMLGLYLISETVVSQSVIEAKPTGNEYFPTNI
tara:strand:- start:203 stop:340 length:138 start_codon:yes stop_codon:yes gene_type:complete